MLSAGRSTATRGRVSVYTHGLHARKGADRTVPKMRTRKSAAKRLRFTSTGKVMFRSNFNSHLLTRKSAKRKRRLQTAKVLDAGFTSAVKAMLPYGQ